MKRLLSFLVVTTIIFSCCLPIVPPVAAATSFTFHNGSSPLVHLGLSGATTSTANFNDMYNISQEFVPASSEIYGAKVAFILTYGTATLRMEISDTPGGYPLASGETKITSVGDTLAWYTMYLDNMLVVTPGQIYYLTYYLTNRQASAICVAYGSYLGANAAEHPAYTWKHSDGAPVLYNKGDGGKVFSFEIISSPTYHDRYYLADPLYHLGVAGSTSSTPNFSSMVYVCQPFIPKSTELYGSRLCLNLTYGSATVHLEVSDTPGGKALASGDTVINSSGDGAYWYDAYLSQKLTVTPHKTYYLTYYLTKRDTSSICIVHGKDLGVNNATYPAQIWFMNQGSTPNFAPGQNNIMVAFRLLTQPKDTMMLYDGESLSGVAGEFNSTVSFSNTRTEGDSSLKLNHLHPVGLPQNVGGMAILTHETFNLKAYDTLHFDLFIEKELTGSNQLQVNFATSGQDGYNSSFDIGAVRAGWHSFSIKLADIPNVSGGNWALIKLIRFTWFHNSQNASPLYFLIDNVYVCDAPDYGDVNADGSITPNDALLALQAAVESISLTEKQSIAASVTESDEVTVIDALFILKRSVKKINIFPIEDTSFSDKYAIIGNTMSQDVLCNYLDRSVTMSGAKTQDYAINFITNVGAKYVSRFACSWYPAYSEYSTYATQKAFIERLHEKDPYVILEACIFETTTKNVETIPIPAYVFEAFGLPVVNRNFDYESMCFPDGSFLNQWATNCSIPDITQLETQMFFYHRAVEYIDMGYEALHMGQVHHIGKYDTNFACYTKLHKMIRDYAKKNARRGIVILNAHTHGLLGNDGVSLFDFNSFPARPMEDGTVAHVPTEADPQRAKFAVNHLDSIYGKSIAAVTPNGWKCDSMPYYVEIDNWGNDINAVNIPNTADISCWGMDEISWFFNQPDWYRAEFLEYAHNWVKNTAPGDGFFCMPGERTAQRFDANKKVIAYWYYGYNPSTHPNGIGDEEVIKRIWNN